ncbi:MAG: hypothetical protein NVS3B21_05690 [Acidimicrobiales bacterium]
MLVGNCAPSTIEIVGMASHGCGASAGGRVGYVGLIVHDANVSTRSDVPVTDAQSKRQQRAAATAEQLLVAARDVFEAKGYAATTVGAITEAANTAHGTFYLYFKNKEDVFGKVMAQVGEDLFKEARAPWVGDPYEALAIATRNYLEVFSSHRGLWRCLFEGMHQSPAIGAMWLNGRRPFVERIQRNLEKLLAAGSIRPLDAALAAESLGSMVEWTAFCFVELGEPAGQGATIDQLAATLADLWYHAVYSRAGEITPATPTT